MRDRLDEKADELGETRSGYLRTVIRDHFDTDNRRAAFPLAFGIAFVLASLLLSGEPRDTAAFVIGGLFIMAEILRVSIPPLRDRFA
jgi:hypothetical protein